MSVSFDREFSRDGRYFAFINSQGKFVVYDAETSNVSQIYIPNLHLNVPCTCFTWIVTGGVIRGQSAKKKKKRSSSSGEPQTFVAFGTSKGGVALYSLASATIERTFKGTGHSGPITAICAVLENDVLYTAGEDGKVLEWSLSENEQKKVHNLGVEKLSCLAVAEQGRAVVSGSKQLKLWDTVSGKLRKTLVGHTSNTMLIQTITDQNERIFLLTGSVNDRYIALWSLEDDKDSPVGLFALDDAPEYFSARMVGPKLHLVGVSKIGVAHYFAKNLDKISINKPVKANFTYEIALDSSSKAVDRIPIFTASVDFTPNEEQLLIAYGTEHSLKFEQIAVEKDVKHNVLIREQISMLHRKGEDGSDLKTRTPMADNATAEFLNPVSAGRKALKTVEIPMEARLENLALTKSRTGHTDVAHLLIQGLHSKDAAILRTVFSKNDPDLIQRTAEKIPSQYVSALLNEISSLMQMKTVHVATAVCWLKALIHSHASQLMALGSENLQSNFGTCLGIIEYRVEHAKSLSKLSGRLELLVSQIDRSEQLIKHSSEVVNKNVIVHQEEDDSDVDSVIGKEHGSNVSSDVESDGAVVDEDDDVGETTGSFVRLRNGTVNQDDALSDEEDMRQLQTLRNNEEDDDEEMDFSD